MTNIKIIFWLETQNINTLHKNFLFTNTNTYYYGNNKHGTVKENLFCASSGIYLLNVFETFGQKLENWLAPHSPPPPNTDTKFAVCKGMLIISCHTYVKFHLLASA